MLRDKNLIPLSHQHQHALALCVRIERAQPIPFTDMMAWQAEIEQLLRDEVAIHFAAEEAVLFPAACKFTELASLVEDLRIEHTALRAAFTQAGARTASTESLSSFARLLSAHIRKEERQLFERLQEAMTAEELAEIGRKLENALKDSTQQCALRQNPQS